jgi:hypothetical protein
MAGSVLKQVRRVLNDHAVSATRSTFAASARRRHGDNIEA